MAEKNILQLMYEKQIYPDYKKEDYLFFSDLKKVIIAILIHSGGNIYTRKYTYTYSYME